MNQQPIAQFSGVSFSASGATILRDLDVSLEPGEVLGISGANGSGKTTLLRLLATLARPTTGTWSVLGAKHSSSRVELSKVRRQIAFIGHTPAVWPELTLRENVDIVESLRGSDSSGLDSLRFVGLESAAGRRAEAASLGMLRRVEFSRVLGNTPQLLLLDEAHAGLDDSATAIVSEVVERVADRGGAVVLVSHEPDRMAKLVTRQATLAAGSLHPVAP